MELSPRNNLITLFARHKVAANLLMMSMIFLGLWAIHKLNVQFLPFFQIEKVNITVVWTGASAEDIERSITRPIELELRSLDFLKEIKSTSSIGRALIEVEFKQGADMGSALEQVREKVSLVRNLPDDAEPPSITRIEHFEIVARVIIATTGALEALRPLMYKMERELLDAGISKIEFTGMPDQEIAIQVPMARLAELHLSLDEIAKIIAKRSKDLPAGTVGKRESGKQVRSLEQKRRIGGFERLPLVTDAKGQLVHLGDIAKITRRPETDEVLVFYNQNPSVQMTLLRTGKGNALEAAKVLQNWLVDIKPQLPPGVTIKVYDQHWQYIQDRIDLLLNNGAQGLFLIILILFIILNGRIAFWITMGIPVSFLAALAVLYFLGDSINMISLFAMIMTLGIIVDDTIVVGEEALSQIQAGKNILDAVEIGAMRMLTPIMASTLTTICAFMPLMLVGGIIGRILFSIPLVVICVLIASVIECFLVLPGHLRHSFKRDEKIEARGFKKRIEDRFFYFREHVFRQWVHRAIDNHWKTVGIAVFSLLIGIALLIGGWLNFTFFPEPEGFSIYATGQFVAGTPPEAKQRFFKEINDALKNADDKLSARGKTLISTAVDFENYNPMTRRRGDQLATVALELIPPDTRDISNDEFITEWKKYLKPIPNIENLTMQSARAGPPGRDIDIELSDASQERLKEAAIALRRKLSTYPGVTNIEDDMPFGQQQIIFNLNAQGRALGLTTNSVGQQIRAAYSGAIAQIYYDVNDELEVRVVLPDNERYSLLTLEQLPIITENKETVPLANVVELKQKQGLDILRHTNTRLAVHVLAKVNARVTNANKVLRSLKQKALPDLRSTYGVSINFKGRFEEQQDTLTDMKFGLMLALLMIYIILAWVFSSYAWPLIIMFTIPLGLTGAIFGHLIMNIDLTVLSLFGLFGLTGIVINDSIILLNRYHDLKAEGLDIHDAIVEASCQRLRAVLLTSLTTIAGLTPLLFERSLQAQFLIPMATSICFGLAYATVLILVVIPAALSIYEDLLNSKINVIKRNN